MPPAPGTSWCPRGLRAGPLGLGRQGGQLARCHVAVPSPA